MAAARATARASRAARNGGPRSSASAKSSRSVAAAVSAMTARRRAAEPASGSSSGCRRNSTALTQAVVQGGEMTLQPHGQIDVAQPGAKRPHQVPPARPAEGGQQGQPAEDADAAVLEADQVVAQPQQHHRGQDRGHGGAQAVEQHQPPDAAAAAMRSRGGYVSPSPSYPVSEWGAGTQCRRGPSFRLTAPLHSIPFRRAFAAAIRRSAARETTAAPATCSTAARTGSVW